MKTVEDLLGRAGAEVRSQVENVKLRPASTIKQRLQRRRVAMVGSAFVVVVGLLGGTAVLLTGPAPNPTSPPLAPAGGETTTTTGPSPTIPAATTTVAGEPIETSDEIMERARRMGLFDRDGEYFGPVDDEGQPFLLPPIEGYADYSNITPQERFDLDLAEHNRLLVECVSDHGFEGGVGDDGIFNQYLLPPDQQQLAMATGVACIEGFRFPKSEPRTQAMWEELYAYQIAWQECAAGYGYAYEKYPTLDQFIALEANFEHDDYPLRISSELDFQGLYDLCPPDPVGGFAAWNPGDPINPVP